MSTNPDLGIVIVSWNVRDLLARCLDSVYASLARSNLRGEIWVVDNASTDGSVEMVRHRFPQIHLIANADNKGFAAANNQALRAMGLDNAQCIMPNAQLPRYAMLLNPDTEVREDALGVLIRFMDETPTAGVCGARLTYPDGTFQHSAFGFPTLAQVFLDFFPLHWRLLESRLNGRYPHRLYERGEPFAIDHPLGAAMLVRRETIAQVGLLDEGYRIYVEEIDWCMRIKRAGWAVYCVPRAEVIHHEAQSTRQVRPQMIVALWRSRFYLFEKHYRPSFRWMARRIVRAGMRAEARRAREAYRCGALNTEELAARLAAYQEVATL
ncbi:MAG: glycosyltransferase family 2 protein [Anaerolineae bacterium]|nr:glycosyltransferase family 2 protein [Anaerolineae bacterium]